MWVVPRKSRKARQSSLPRVIFANSRKSVREASRKRRVKMANKTVSVDLVFNVKDGELVSATKRTDALATSTTKASKAAASGSGAFSTLGGSISKLAGVAGIALSLAALANAIKNQVSVAIRLNSAYEDLIQQMTSMVYINTTNVTTTGKAITAQEKYALATQEAKKQMAAMREVAARTGYSINELGDAYKAYGTGAAKQMGFDKMQKSFEAIAIAAKGSGRDISTLVMGLDNLAAGTVVAGSELGIFLNGLGLSNDAIKAAIAEGQLYELIMEKTASAVEAANQSTQTYTQATNALKSAWNNLLQEAGSGYFEGIKKSINDLTAWINDYKDTILAWVEFLVEKFSNAFGAFVGYAQQLFGYVGDAIKWVASLFGEATSEMSAFEIVLSGIGTVLDVVAVAFKTLGNAISAIIAGLKGAINALQTAYYNVKDFFGLADAEDAAKMQRLIAEREQGAETIKGIWKKQIEDTKGFLNDLDKTWTKKERTAAEAVGENKFSGVGELQTAKSPLSSMGADITKSTKKQIDTLKSWWDAEFEIREKNLELMAESRQKELEAEQLRFDKVISNLNFEIQKKIESGEITIEQANALYEAEEKIHQKRMKSISEYNETYENLMKNINSALESNIQNALTGKFSNAGDFFKDLFSSMQQSFAQGLATSMAQAIMSADVAKSFTEMFSSAIDKVSSWFGASGGVVNQSGEGASSSGGANTLNQIGFWGSLVGIARNFNDQYGVNTDQGEESVSENFHNKFFSTVTLSRYAEKLGIDYGGLNKFITGFSKRKTEVAGQGVQLWAQATAESINASTWQTMKETTSKFWGLQEKTKEWTEYFSADSESLRVVRETLRNYQYLIEDINGEAQKITVSAGKYNSYQEIINKGAKSTIAAILGVDEYVYEAFTNSRQVYRGKGYDWVWKIWGGYWKKVDRWSTEYFTDYRWVENSQVTAIYKVWESYAASVNKEVSTALAESLQSYVDTGNTFEAWKLEFEGKSTEALKFAADLANEQVERILETLGAKDVTIDNYLAYRETALKESFDPTTIEYINTLGEYLMSAAEATQKYEEALKDETATKLNLIDPFLAKTAKIEEINADNTSTSEKLNLQILSTLKQILRIDQENQNELYGTPAVAVARA